MVPPLAPRVVAVVTWVAAAVVIDVAIVELGVAGFWDRTLPLQSLLCAETPAPVAPGIYLSFVDAHGGSVVESLVVKKELSRPNVGVNNRESERKKTIKASRYTCMLYQK